MKILYILTLILIISTGSFAQSDLLKELESEQKQETEGFDKTRLYYGGYMNLSFGTYTAIGIEPLVAYKFTPQFSLGVKLTYEYSNYDISSASSYGGSLFGRYRVMPRLYVHAEFSEVNYELFYYSGVTHRTWVPFLFLGGGFSQPVSENVWLNTQILFDALQNENSPYERWEPFFSIGFGVGF
jgi:hypothetical protein